MTNTAIAGALADIASLLEIKADNAFKIRAYRAAADTVAHWPDAVSRMDDTRLKAVPGIGRDLAARIRELADTGRCQLLEELKGEYPATILDLLQIQGVGPKTVAQLYGALGIGSVDDLAAAARDGRLREIRGMGPRKAALILKAIEERQRSEGRFLLSATATAADDLLAHLRDQIPGVELVPVGSLRRGCETCGDIDVLAAGGPPALMEAFVAYPKVERVLGQGDTKASVRLWTGQQADLRRVPVESTGAALQYFTGSKAHNIVLRDRAAQRGYKLNEYGLFRVDDEQRVAGASEPEIYEALGLRYVEPELRENRGEIEAAETGALPGLLAVSDIRGDLHMHTTATDGRDDLPAMAEGARRAGLQYIAITDHSRALAMANGLDEGRALAHASAVRALNGRIDGLTLLAGIECDILADGRLDLADDCLAQLDIVVASVHSHFTLDEAQMTDRILRALENPWVDILGHPTGRLLLKRQPYAVNLEAIADAAARLGVALEVNCQVDRLDLNDAGVRLARERGAQLVVSTDAHSATAFDRLRWGVLTARRGWATPSDILNTRSLDDLRPLLRRHRRR